MFDTTKSFSKQIGTYQEIIQTLSEACSSDFDSPGLKLLQDTADSLKIAVEKLSELEMYVRGFNNSRSKSTNSVTNLEMAGTLQENFDADRKDFEQKKENKHKLLKTFFTIHENVAECNLIEALQKKGFFNFQLNLLGKKENFAYGFIIFDNEDTFMEAVSVSTKIIIGQSVLKMLPTYNSLRKELRKKKINCKNGSKKRKRK